LVEEKAKRAGTLKNAAVFARRGSLRPLRQGQSVFALAPLELRRTRYVLRPQHGCATRSPKGEAWWARQDSNLQPDRYERLKALIPCMKARIVVKFRRCSCAPLHLISEAKLRRYLNLGPAGLDCFGSK
jgi:hypothetical protein